MSAILLVARTLSRSIPPRANSDISTSPAYQTPAQPGTRGSHPIALHRQLSHFTTEPIPTERSLLADRITKLLVLSLGNVPESSAERKPEHPSSTLSKSITTSIANQLSLACSSCQDDGLRADWKTGDGSSGAFNLFPWPATLVRHRV